MLVGKRIRLRAIEYEDLPLIVQWRNEPEVYHYFYEHEPLSLVMQKRWFEGLLQKQNEKLWLIEILETSEIIGTIGLVGIDWRNRKAEWGRFLIYPAPYRQQGYGVEAAILLLIYGFEHLNLHRLFCEVFADNQRAYSLYRKLQFKEEGRLRQHIFREGQYQDVIALSLLKSEYWAETKPVIESYYQRWDAALESFKN